MEKKSIVEQALLQINTIEEATKKNAKGILSSVMKEQLNNIMNEEEDVKNKNVKKEEDVIAEQEAIDEPTDVDNIETEVAEQTNDEDDEPEIDGEDLEAGDDEPEIGEEIPTDVETMDDDVIDATEFSDEEVVRVFKSMKPEDGVVVKKDGDEVKLDDEDVQYIIKLDEGLENEFDDTEENFDDTEESFDDEDDFENLKLDDEDEDFDTEGLENEEESVYEIELGDEDLGNDEYYDDENNPFDDINKPKEEEIPEASRTMGNGVRPPKQKMKFKAGRRSDVGEINEEVGKLKKQNGEYKEALKLFKDKLNEVAVFNANLAHATRLFTESSTTKNEKLEILKRFDKANSMTESKALYEQIKTELGTKKPISESINSKLNTTPKRSSSEVLNETKAYENQQHKRIKEIMYKINNNK